MLNEAIQNFHHARRKRNEDKDRECLTGGSLVLIGFIGHHLALQREDEWLEDTPVKAIDDYSKVAARIKEMLE